MKDHPHLRGVAGRDSSLRGLPLLSSPLLSSPLLSSLVFSLQLKEVEMLELLREL